MVGLRSFLVFAICAFFLGSAEVSFAKRADGTHRGLGIGLPFAFGYSTILAVVHGFVCHLRDTKPEGWAGWELFFAFFLVAGMLVLVYRFYTQGDEIREFLSFLVAIVGTGFFALQAASYASSTLEGFGQRVVAWLPWVVFAFSVGALFYCFLAALDHTVAAWITAIIIGALMFIISAIVLLPNWHGLKHTVDPEPIPSESDDEFGVEDYIGDEDIEWGDEETEDDEYGFYNLSLQSDDDPDNDFNFGWNPFEESKTVDIYDEDFRQRLEVDPAFAAANMAWCDYWCKTRFIGKFYDEVDEQWDAAINAAKDGFIEDRDLYYRTVATFEAFLDTATPELRFAKGGISDQMYQNPYTVSGIPDVIVMKTDNHDGHFLIYVFTIKGEKVEVGYRIECGYQPTNCEKTLKIDPSPKPVPPTPTASGNNPEPTPKPTPTPTPTPKKDKKQDIWKPEDGFPSNGGDPGPDTNNGVGAEESKYEEQHTDSQDFKTVEDYKKEVEERKKVDEEQKTGEDKNTPSTPKQSDTKKVEQSSERKEIKNDPDNQGGEKNGVWEGTIP